MALLNKRGSIAFTIMILALFLVSCASSSSKDPKPSGEVDVWDQILSIGKLEFLTENLSDENQITGFMRILIVILTFAVLHAVARAINLPNPIPVVVPLIISIITGLFLPGEILIGIGSSYAIFVAAAFIAIPLIGGGYLLYIIPNQPVIWRFVRLIILGILLWILLLVQEHAQALTSTILG